ncbi:MAG TPA: hypothetical protein VFQ23_05125 [Anaerolineales bacterium]|nr:hypothetical protein [Anaerolineales bacterium]
MTTLLNSGEFLHTPSEDTFVMQGITWKFPIYETIDEFFRGLR